MIKPKKLNIGDKVAIVSLSSGILGESFCKHQIDIGIKRMKSFGLEPVFMPNSLKGREYLSNCPKARAQDLKEAFFDDSIKGIICAIGGDDTFRLLPYLMEDQEFIKKVQSSPKIFTGFSDTTNNHFMFHKLGITTFYGPNFLNDLAELDYEMLPYSKEAFSSFFKNDKLFNIDSSPIWYEERKDFSVSSIGTPRVQHQESKGYEVLRGSGIVTGKLLGGCLESLYDMLTGNRYPEQKKFYEKYNLFPSKDEWTKKILFIETSEEKPLPNVFLKMMSKLKEHGLLEVVEGIIVGKPQDGIFYEEYKGILNNIANEYRIPIIYNVNFGHAYPRTIIPYGLEIELNLDEKTIKIMEPLFD